MKFLIFALVSLGLLNVHAGMYAQVFPDLNNDGLRDKVELTYEESEEFSSVKLYIAKAKYEFELVSTGKFLIPGDQAGPSGEWAVLSVSDKNEIVIYQMIGSSERSYYTHVFEFRKDNLYLTKLNVVDVYFEDETDRTIDYVKGTITTQKRKNNRPHGKKVVDPLPERELLPLNEVQGDEMESDVVGN